MFSRRNTACIAMLGIVMSLVAMGQRGDIGEARQQWLKVRDACGGDVACFSRAYQARIVELEKVMDEIASRGPF